jgi:nicotinamidase-related amidase
VLALEETKGALANCRAALTHARAAGMPVAYVRWIDRTPLFNKATRFSRWIEGFEPHGADMIFERNRPSCYASADFAEVVGLGGGSFVLAGFAGEAACLATTVDAFHRGHTVTYLTDASASHALDDIGANEVHRVVSGVVGLYGDVITTRSWIARTSRRNSWKGLGDGTEQGRTA